MLSLGKSGLVYLVSNIAVAAVPFALLPVLTHYLSPTEYGVVAMFTTFLPIIGAFVGLSVHGAISRRWFDKENVKIDEYVSSCIFILLCSMVVVLIAIGVMSSWLSEALSLPLHWLVAAVVVSFCGFLIQVRLVIWQVESKPIHYGIFQFGNAFLNAVVSLVLVAILLYGYSGRLWGYLVSALFFGALGIALLKRDRMLGARIRREYIKDALMFGVPLIPHVIGSFLIVIADRLVVKEILGTEQAGIYMLAVQVSLVLNMIFVSLEKAYTPWLYKRLKDNISHQKEGVVRLTYLLFGLISTLVFVMIFLSDILINIIAPPEYSGAAEVLPWLFMAQGFHGMYYLVTNYLFFNRKTYVTASITIFCGGISIFLTIILTYNFGLVGTAVGTAIGLFFQFSLTWLMAAKVHSMPWFRKATE
ncbi:polysaccharide biosynthesis protein [Halomonas sp. DQ26W]|uniref:lipopolysaccharide biosynthesis protein n=1 Tax=Halomonas sp. DQ26W TaxID=2282311 RepID=UPI000DF78630|nr:oligosaccharide flippase family protein [Halomonas sp. DQ26W]RDB42154.1 polysaccharide biosynthesis protein [Halomonas sp. DQ26W]